jgi:hypothetical protein
MLYPWLLVFICITIFHFLVFHEDFLHATSFRMTSFAPREAMTTAKPPEPFASFMISVLFLSLNPSGIDGPAARHFC